MAEQEVIIEQQKTRIAELEQEVVDLKSQVADLKSHIAELNAKIDKLTKMLFGKKLEKSKKKDQDADNAAEEQSSDGRHIGFTCVERDRDICNVRQFFRRNAGCSRRSVIHFAFDAKAEFFQCHNGLRFHHEDVYPQISQIDTDIFSTDGADATDVY